MAFSGSMTFNPTTDPLVGADGKEFMLQPPSSGDLPSKGFLRGREQYGFPIASTPDATVSIAVSPTSDRLQLLAPFKPWAGTEFAKLPILVKVEGKCTTDHISAAGPWLKYKGHLENLAANTLIGATNAYTKTINVTTSALTGLEGTIPEVGFEYKAKGVQSIVVADWNYGEGSAREHAAM